jgi:hypothetical protein
MISRHSLQAANAASLFILALLATVVPIAAARADCQPVIAAFLKADATKRFAMYNVDSLDGVAKGEPMFVTIGDVKYSENNVQKGLTIVTDGFTKGAPSYGFEANALRKDEQKGKLKCKQTADRKIAGDPAVSYHVGSTDGGVYGVDPGAFDLWISKKTGLPLIYSLDPDTGGFRYVYGDQVVAPAASKIRK